MSKGGKFKLDDREWRALKRRLDAAGRSNVKIGVLASKGGSEMHESGKVTLAELMAIHEFGSEAAGIPARKPLRTFVEKSKQPLRKMMHKLAHKVIEDRLRVVGALSILGEFAAAEAKKTITTGPKLEPALAASTVARKKSDRPLVDTGQLVNSISWEIE